MCRSLMIAVAAISISACVSAQPQIPPIALTSHAVSQADYPPEALKLGEQGTLIYRRTGNLRAVQLLLGHTKIESTVRYLGIEVDDALAIAEQIDV